MTRPRRLLGVGVLMPVVLLAGQPDRSELVRNPKFVPSAVEPDFVRLTTEELQSQILVISSRSYAAVGFNNPEVQIHLPRCDNSIYAVVDFLPARLVAAAGEQVTYEPERGIYDHDTHSDELRFTPIDDGAPVEFARAEGTIRLRYPLRMRTVSLTAGSTITGGAEIAIDGPFVSWTGTEPDLPEAASFTPVEQWRAFDASGRRLVKHPDEGFSMQRGITTETYAYWGEVEEVRVDVVEEWGELEIAYSLPSIDALPAERAGTPPETRTVTATPGGEVSMQSVATATVSMRNEPTTAAPAPVTTGPSKDEAIAQLQALGFRRFDANAFVLAATRGRDDALRLFLAAGMPVDTESGGRTALMSAAMMGHVEAGKVLIAAGADVNRPDSSGSPALARLVMHCNATELVQAFIDAGADVSVTLRGGVTARAMAELANCADNAAVLARAESR